MSNLNKMSFLDNFKFAFLPMVWKKKTWTMNDYNEMVVDTEENINIEGVLLDKTDFKSIKIDTNSFFSEKEYQLRVNNQYQIKKYDEIIVNDNILNVEYVEPVYIDGKIDHIKAILKVKN